MPTDTKDKLDYLKNEITAFENRLVGIKSEIGSLTIRRDSLKKEIADAIDTATRTCEQKNLETRQLSARTLEASNKLDADKVEFQAVLRGFKQEKVAFDREKQEALDIKANYTKMTERVTRFIALVNKESAVL